MLDLPRAYVTELRRLVVLLDHPDLVANGAGHRFNRRFTLASRRVRHIPFESLRRYAKTYARLLERALVSLLVSPSYLAADDYARRYAIRAAEATVAAATDRAFDRVFRATALVVVWADAVDADEPVPAGTLPRAVLSMAGVR